MTLKLQGSTSGHTAIDAPASAGSNTLVLPPNNGSAGQVLRTDGNGNLTWVDLPATPAGGKLRSYVQIESDTDTDLGSATGSNTWTDAPAPFNGGLQITSTAADSKFKIFLHTPFYQDRGDLDFGVTASYKIGSGSYTRLGHTSSGGRGLYTGYFNSPGGASDYMWQIHIDYIHTPSSYSTGDVLTYKFEYWTNQNDCHWNGIRPGRAYARVEELAP